jgi:hypothetical protein
MSTSTSEERRARRQARALRGLLVHLALYVSVALGVFAVTGSPHVGMLVGWGFAVALHAVVIGCDLVLDETWEDRFVARRTGRNG